MNPLLRMVQIGGRVWEKHGIRRVYFDDFVFDAGVSGKVWIEIDSGEFGWSGMDESTARGVIRAIEAAEVCS